MIKRKERKKEILNEKVGKVDKKFGLGGTKEIFISESYVKG